MRHRVAGAGRRPRVRAAARRQLVVQRSLWIFAAILLAAAPVFTSEPTFAQSVDAKSSDKPAAQPAGTATFIVAPGAGAVRQVNRHSPASDTGDEVSLSGLRGRSAFSFCRADS